MTQHNKPFVSPRRADFAFPAPGDVCPDTGRVAVLATAFCDSSLNGDAYAYWYDNTADQWGMDPWQIIESIDRHATGSSMDAVFTDGSVRLLSVRRCIFVSAKHAAILRDECAKAAA